MLDKAKNWAVIIEYNDHSRSPRVSLRNSMKDALDLYEYEMSAIGGIAKVRIFKFAGDVRQMTIFSLDKSTEEKEELPW